MAGSDKLSTRWELHRCKKTAHEEHKRSTNMSRQGIAVTSQPFFSPTFFVFRTFGSIIDTARGFFVPVEI
ncbi:hypothetical protein V6Z12_A13G254400 [Gossypium hirsutum]